MKIETLINLIKGELLNSPYISEVTSFTQDVEEINRGSCFFVRNKRDIKKAIKNGAYAIISEDYEKIVDNEIAWIKVNSLEKSIIDIFKYENIKTKIYFCDDITQEIIEKMNLNKEVLILKTLNDLLKALSLNYKLLITSNEQFLKLFSNYEKLKSKKIEFTQITLFKSKYNGIELNLPYVYKNEFSKALKFFEDNNLKYTFEFCINRFKPIFVDFNFVEVNYGESERVLITGIKNDEYFFNELNYLIENTKHAKTIIVNEKNKRLLKESFNFAMCVDFELKLGEKNESRLFEH